MKYSESYLALWSFSKIGEIQIWWISDSKGVNVFQNTPFKDVKILR